MESFSIWISLSVGYYFDYEQFFCWDKVTTAYDIFHTIFPKDDWDDYYIGVDNHADRTAPWEEVKQDYIMQPNDRISIHRTGS